MFYNGLLTAEQINPISPSSFFEKGKVVKNVEAEVVNPKMCKETTLEQIHQMLLKVVEDVR